VFSNMDLDCGNMNRNVEINENVTLRRNKQAFKEFFPIA